MVGVTPDGATARTGDVNDASGEGAIGCCEGRAVFDGARDGADGTGGAAVAGITMVGVTPDGATARTGGAVNDASGEGAIGCCEGGAVFDGARDGADGTGGAAVAGIATVGATPDGATARTGAVNDASGEGAIGCCEGGAVFDGACDGADGTGGAAVAGIATVGATPDGATARTGAVNDASGEGAIGCCEGGAVFDGACDGAGRTWDDAGGADVGLAAGNGGGAPRGVNGDGGSPAGGARFASADACSPAGRREGGALSFALAVASFALGGALFFPSFALFDGGNDEADGLATADGSAGGGLFDDAKRGNGVINGAWSAVAGADETREAAAGGLDDDRFLADVECCA